VRPQHPHLRRHDVRGAQHGHPHREDLEDVAAAQLLPRDRLPDHPEQHVHELAVVERLEEPVLRGLLDDEPGRRDRRLGPVDVLLRDREVRVVARLGCPAGPGRVAADERERDLGIRERDGHEPQAVLQRRAVVRRVDEGTLLAHRPLAGRLVG
jgi:hypothetical protein